MKRDSGSGWIHTVPFLDRSRGTVDDCSDAGDDRQLRELHG